MIAVPGQHEQVVGQPVQVGSHSGGPVFLVDTSLKNTTRYLYLGPIVRVSMIPWDWTMRNNRRSNESQVSGYKRLDLGGITDVANPIRAFKHALDHVDLKRQGADDVREKPRD